MSDSSKDPADAAIEPNAKPEWMKPEITSFAPVQAAEGISYRPNDGISNLT